MSPFLKFLISAFVILFFPAQAIAEIDGKSALICAIADVHDCSAGKGCKAGDNESLVLPDFVRIDFAKKEITAHDAEESDRKTIVQTISPSDIGFLLQGSAHGRGWTMSINKLDGEFTLAATGNGLTFTAFGVCTKD